MSANNLLSCWDDIQTRMQSIAELDGKVFKAADADNLTAQLKALAPPAVGVAYEGSRGQPEQGHTAQGKIKLGVFGIYLVVANVKFAPGVDTKTTAVNILRDIETQMRATRSPTGHYWQFLVESLAANGKDHSVWVSRWQTPIVG